MDDNSGTTGVSTSSTIQTTSTATDSIKTAGDIQMATGKSVRLNAAGTTSAMDNAGQLVLTGADGSTRVAGVLTVGGVSTLGNGSTNYVTVTPAASSSHPAVASAGSDTNINVNVAPKGTGKLTVNGLAVPVVHGTGTVQQAIETGTAMIGGGGSVAVTFSTAFGADPVCVGTSTGAAGDVVSTAGASTTGVTFQGAPGDTIDWIAIGRL